MWGCGQNSFAFLTPSVDPTAHSPVRVTSLSFRRISVGPDFVAAIASNGSVVAWGSSGSGAIVNSSGIVISPTQIGGSTSNATDILSLGTAILFSGSLWMFPLTL